MSRKSLIKRLTACITAAVFVLGTCFYPVSSFALTEDLVQEGATAAEPTDKGTGYHDIQEVRERIAVEEEDRDEYMDQKKRKLRGELPAVYDPRKYSWFKNRVDVLDQGDTETCWAHAAATVAQISYLYELNNQGKTIDQDYDLSALGFGYNFYNRQAYPDYGYTANDRNISSSAWKQNGGNNYMSAQAMANWMGMHSRASGDTPYTYNDVLKLENAEYISDIYYSVDDLYNLNVDLTKEAISEHGAVMASIYYDDAYLNEDESAYYCDYSYGNDYWDAWGMTNHAVSIVG
ncbi:MAG: hypothetical protein Q4A65_00750 [Bacillota bacterium]|nr:hypothetical protein [Bacillota bacterium]